MPFFVVAFALCFRIWIFLLNKSVRNYDCSLSISLFPRDERSFNCIKNKIEREQLCVLCLRYIKPASSHLKEISLALYLQINGNSVSIEVLNDTLYREINFNKSKSIYCPAAIFFAVVLSSGYYVKDFQIIETFLKNSNFMRNFFFCVITCEFSHIFVILLGRLIDANHIHKMWNFVDFANEIIHAISIVYTIYLIKQDTITFC